MSRGPLDATRRLALSESNAKRLRESDLRVVITGASGWLGQAALEMLESALETGFRERVAAFASRARGLELRSGRMVELSALSEIGLLPRRPTLLLHFAFLTKDKVEGFSAEGYTRANAAIRSLVAEAVSHTGVTHILLPSSGAVYGLPPTPDRSLRLDAVNNPYGTEKILDEQLFLAIARQTGAAIIVPRIFNLAGPFINKHDAYALSSIINAALRGGPIALRARRRVVRAYAHVRDVLDVSIGALLNQAKGQVRVFDTGGEPVEVGELALRALQAMQQPDLRIERPPLEPQQEDCYLGDGTAFVSLANAQGIQLADLDAQIRATIDYLRTT